jgi:uncharacterized protein (TIGR02246 family)
LLIAVVLASGLQGAVALGQAANDEGSQAPAADQQAVDERAQQFVEAFNAGKSDQIAAMCLPRAEVTDDAGNTYTGREEIASVFARFFAAFPGAEVTTHTKSLRLLGPSLALREGTRSVTLDDGSQATNRFVTVYVKQEGQWMIASVREYAADPEPTTHERLDDLAWLVGDWVDEDSESSISIRCRWTEDENFLLVDYNVRQQGETTMRSQQRIGWDPLSRHLRSWIFDSDGGYGSGHWTQLDGQWIVKSTAVLPDGRTGTATFIYEPVDEDTFRLYGLDRIVGNVAEPDIEVTIVRRPPQPGE